MGGLNGKASYFVLGAAAVVGAKWLTPVFVPVLTGIVKPIAKTTLKLGWIGMGYARELGHELIEVIEDAAAEARQELEQEARAANAKEQNGAG